MLNKPFKIIHQYKNDYQRTQYLTYIFLGSLIPDEVMNILDRIKNNDLISTLNKLSKKDIELLNQQFGEQWYESLFISDHIIKTFTDINKDKNLLNKLSSKFTESWVNKNIKKYKLIKKNLIFNHQSKFRQFKLNTNKPLTQKKDYDYRTQIFDKQLPEQFVIQPITTEFKQEGGEDKDSEDDIEDIVLESIEDLTDIESDSDEEITETEEDLKKVIEIEDTIEEPIDKKTSVTADLISQALNEKSWKKEKSDKIDFNTKINELTFDANLENIYQKYYITNTNIYPDDNIKTIRQKITYAIPSNPSFTKENHILPSRQYLYAKYYFKNKQEQIMIGQKWSRRNELLNIDVIPNNNLQIYMNLRGNLKYLRDNFGVKIKREEEEDFILRDYEDYITMNEIYLVDIYSQLGQNFKIDPDKKRNLYEVFISIYFPFITSTQLNDIINMLNQNDNGEEDFINQKYKTIRNDLKLENETIQLIQTTLKKNIKNISKIFYENYIIQSIIHINMFDKNNITGTFSEEKFNLYAIFDSFIINEDYPLIKYYSLENGLIFKFYQKSNLLKDQDTMRKWFDNNPYGITIKKKINEDKHINITINENGKIEYRMTWKEEDKATINDVKKTYDIIRDVIKKINTETPKVKFINPEDERFNYAFVNSIQKFELNKSINHNELSDFSRYFFPFISVVIEPKKRIAKIQSSEKTSKYGTYLRYKRVSKYENRTRMHLRILYIMRNYEFTDKELINEVAKQFNITMDVAAKELDFVRLKYANALKKTRKNLQKLSSLPINKPPGIGIDIQGRNKENYKVRITGSQSKKQLEDIQIFMNTLIYLYSETYLNKNPKYQKIKETLKKLTNIAKRRNKVSEIVDYSSQIKDVKKIISLDKKRLGFRPEEGQNQWTRSCQNSGDEKRRPTIVSNDNIQNLIKKGFKYDEKIKMYVMKKFDKDLKKEIIMRAINLPNEDGTPIYYYCDPDINNKHKYIGFLSKGNNPNDLCMPCCFKKDQYVSTNKTKLNYFKKCIGEVKDYQVEKKSLDTIGERLYILQETNKVQEGRFLFLTKYLDYFFNKIWDNQISIKNHYMTLSETGYFLKFTVKDKKYHFMASISAIYDLTFDQIIDKIILFFNNKNNLKYFYFLDEGRIFQRFETLDNYLVFIKEKKNLDYSIIGEAITLPGILEKEGLGIYIFNKDINKKTNKPFYYLDCLNGSNKKYLFNYQKNIFLIKDTKYYFPILQAIKKNKNDKIKINKIFDFENKNGNIVNQVRGLYISSCSENILEQLSISSKYTVKYTTELLKSLKPTKQYLDASGKVRYLELEKIVIPVFPSGLDYLFDYSTSEPKITNLEKTIKNIDPVIKIDNNFKPEKLLYSTKIKVNYSVHAILLANKLILPVVPEKITENQAKKFKLTLEQRPPERNINHLIVSQSNPINQTRLAVKESQYLEEGYNLFRFELSYHLQKNPKIKKEIKEIIESNIPDKEKRNLLRPYLISITNPKLKKFFKNSSVKKQTYFIMSLDKKPDLKNFKITNQRNYCLVNKNKDNCHNKPFCKFVEDRCYFSMEDEIIIEYINRVIEEFIRQGINYKEIIQEDNYFVSDIVNNNDFTNRENQKILKANNIGLNKILSEFFGNDVIPTIGKRKSSKVNINKDNYPKLEQIGDNYSQEVMPNNDSNIRAFINGYYWLKNPLYFIDRRNLGYLSNLQNKLVNLLKAKIIDFVLQYQGKVPKLIEKYFENKNSLNSKLMDFTTSNLNTNGELEFFILSLMYNIPIILFDKFNNIISVFDNGKIIYDEKITKTYSFKNSIKIKHNKNPEVKLPNNIFSLY